MKRTWLVWAALVVLMSIRASAQASLAGTWQGTITFGPQTLRVGLVVTATASGYDASLVVIDQDGARVPVQRVTLTGRTLHLDIPALRATYEGALDATGSVIAGALLQMDMPTALGFRRVAALDDPPVFGEAERAAVAATVNGYFAAFTGSDFEAFAMVLQVPFTRLPPGGAASVTTSLDDVVAGYRMARAGLERTEYVLSRAVSMTITPTSANTALVDLHWRRDKKDGSVFQEGAEILTVVRTSTGWKINGNFGRALSHYGKRF